jgi:regulatory subunit for Cdc7p protein kinase
LIQHIYSKRHRKFAEEDANFAKLDIVLSRVRRRTLEEVAAEQSEWDCSLSQTGESESEDDDQDAEHDSDEEEAIDVDDDLDLGSDRDVNAANARAQTTIPDDIAWNEWVEEDA